MTREGLRRTWGLFIRSTQTTAKWEKDMSIGRTVKLRAGAATALVGVALLVAACGSASSSSSTTTTTATAAAAPVTTSTSSGSATTGVSIGTAKGPDGTYLTGASGRALYLWVADTGGKSNCAGACAMAWPPLLTKGAPVASSGVSKADLGTTTRSDGTKQVTYMGHPLYYFVADTSAGSTKGQGSDSFGAKWWLVAPSGSAITSGSSAKPASSSSGGSSGTTSTAGGSWS
jgi:predicted lipoprotein with Yx(FWY)xxD motif